MKLLYPLIILSAFSFAEDEYPYFSDANKQLEFEQKKISFNLLSSDFTIDGKKFEIDEFFGIIGLPVDQKKVEEKNENALKRYNVMREIYYESLNRWSAEYDSTNNLFISDSIIYQKKWQKVKNSYDKKYKLWNSSLIVSAIVSLGADILFLSLASNEPLKGMLFMFGGLAQLFYVYSLQPEIGEKYNEPVRNQYFDKLILPESPQMPIIDYGYSVETLLNLAESYNRKIYEKIN